MRRYIDDIDPASRALSDRDAGLAGRHPDLLSGKATLRLRHDAAGAIPDDELRELARAALDP